MNECGRIEYRGKKVPQWIEYDIDDEWMREN
jgi:hypothetical protein